MTQSNLEADLRDFEQLLRESVTVHDSFLSDVTRHLIDAGGKRIRPVLAITAAQAGNSEVTKDVLMSGIAVELVHLASLYHDDVMDDANTRRNVESVNSRWGNLVAIVAGDYLLAKAAGIAARLGREIAELLADTLADLCAGQILEVQTAYKTSRTVDSYFESIAGKTASLMATSCRIGALAANLDRDQVEMVTDIGRSLGMVFQIRDDILDLIAPAEVLGKKPAQDLMEGIYTLPVLEALRTPAGPSLKPLLTNNMDDSSIQKALEIIVETNGIALSWAKAVEYANSSFESGKTIGSPNAIELGGLANFILDETLQLVKPYLD